MKAYEYLSRDELQKLISESTSYSEVLKKVGLKPSGANHTDFKAYVNDLKFDLSTMLGRSILRNKELKEEKTPLEAFTTNSKIGSTKIKRKLFSKGLKEKKCELCGITEWNGKPLSFELHHINGDKYDNRFENLIILCPNCHSQTDNFRGRNSNTKKEHSNLDKLIEIALNDKENKHNKLIEITDAMLLNRDKRLNPEKYIVEKPPKPIKEKKYCEICGKLISNRGSRFCSIECAQKHNTRNIPSKEELLETSKKVYSLSELNRVLNRNVCDNAVKKWCINYGIYDEIKNNFLQRTYPIIQYSLDGSFIREWKDGYEIEKELGINRLLIQKCCIGRNNTSNGYIWKYKKDIK